MTDALAEVRIGFLGKLPARGDFCMRGLPRGFCDAWDGWLAEVMPGSREILGETWLAAWLEAPVWRFALPPGQCGAEAVAGLMLPSVDRAGRHWPLTLAAVTPDLRVAPAVDEAWLGVLEDAGLEAVLSDATPDRLAERLVAAPPAFTPDGAAAQWWTQGAPRVAPRRFAAGALPSTAAFAAMLSDEVP
ncbi:type VI secretion system-associated protein TagF [Roseomonas sp. AR75]|jgi:type VI secretion system protein ImpM|uniref:type VI secretion system-associated protein TagF n=1 Tax=Roseomonas sp. AR75 TaxID=2562311 RepID=UPI0010C0CE0B|nr:type VI secretion system-associated protein TagF [Roseomonas sp. AR75]